MTDSTNSDQPPRYLYEVTADDFPATPAGEKCDFCHFETAMRFLIAASEKHAAEMVNGDAAEDGPYNGFCGGCMGLMLATNASLVGEDSHYELQENAPPTAEPTAGGS